MSTARKIGEIEVYGLFTKDSRVITVGVLKMDVKGDNYWWKIGGVDDYTGRLVIQAFVLERFLNGGSYELRSSRHPHLPATTPEC